MTKYPLNYGDDDAVDVTEGSSGPARAIALVRFRVKPDDTKSRGAVSLQEDTSMSKKNIGDLVEFDRAQSFRGGAWCEFGRAVYENEAGQRTKRVRFVGYLPRKSESLPVVNITSI